MNREEFNKKWEDYFFVMLDLPTPNVDVGKLENWVRTKAHSQKDALRVYSNVQENRLNYINSTIVYRIMDHGEWFYEFDKEFPEIVKFINTLPVKTDKWQLVVESPKENSIKSTSIHVDELKCFGFRAYLNHSRETPVIYRIKEGVSVNRLTEFNKLDSSDDYIIDDGMFMPDLELLEQDTMQLTECPNTGYSWLLNNTKVAHAGIYPDEGPDKYILFPATNDPATDILVYDMLDDILTKSIVKNKDYIIKNDV